VLRAISPEATPEEVAAIVTAIAALGDLSTSGAGSPSSDGASTDEVGLREWVRGSRLLARGAPLQRGPWRLSGRVERRPRA
jgi:hypothetical protein